MVIDQTLRFVKSLPKRERLPLKNKFKNADASGESALGGGGEGRCVSEPSY